MQTPQQRGRVQTKPRLAILDAVTRRPRNPKTGSAVCVVALLRKRRAIGDTRTDNNTVGCFFRGRHDARNIFRKMLAVAVQRNDGIDAVSQGALETPG